MLSFTVFDFEVQPNSARDTDHEKAALLTGGCSDSSLTVGIIPRVDARDRLLASAGPVGPDSTVKEECMSLSQLALMWANPVTRTPCLAGKPCAS